VGEAIFCDPGRFPGWESKFFAIFLLSDLCRGHLLVNLVAAFLRLVLVRARLGTRRRWASERGASSPTYVAEPIIFHPGRPSPLPS
jgi:hypothetical protein